eukprot:5784062-Pyramimonas_sp.AAC.1
MFRGPPALRLRSVEHAADPSPGSDSSNLCRGSRDEGRCKRGSARAPDLAGSCRAKATPTQ